MGNQPSSGTSNGSSSSSSSSSPSSEQITQLLQYARAHYDTNPTDALLALLQALQLNSGPESAERAMERIRQELGSDICHHVQDRQGRLDRAVRMVQQLVSDESTVLFAQGNQHLLQQAMEDGSSVVCSKCGGMVPAARWQQHAAYWCQAVEDEEHKDEEHETGDNHAKA